MSDTEDTEFGYTEWRCENCGHGTPRHNPPCTRCGNMRFEQVEVRPGDFDDEVRPASTRELLRENAHIVGATALVLLVAGVAVLASAGVFVVADPFGLGYRFGAVEAVPADDDGTLTAAELHGQIADEYDDTSMRWYGRGLELSYTSTAGTNEELVAELTGIAERYAAYAGDGGDARSLRITANVEGRGRVRVTVDRADAAAFAAGDISRAEYQSRVFEGSGDG